jgi:hypothetical protein
MLEWNGANLRISEVANPRCLFLRRFLLVIFVVDFFCQSGMEWVGLTDTGHCFC